MKEHIKTIKFEVTNLRLKMNVMEKDEYVRRLGTIEGALKELDVATEAATNEIYFLRNKRTELETALDQKGKKAKGGAK